MKIRRKVAEREFNEVIKLIVERASAAKKNNLII